MQVEIQIPRIQFTFELNLKLLEQSAFSKRMLGDARQNGQLAEAAAAAAADRSYGSTCRTERII